MMAFPLLGAIGAGAAGLGAGIESLVNYLGGRGGGNFLAGYPSQAQQFPRFSPQQQNVQDQALQQILEYLQSGGNKAQQPGIFNNFDFAPIEQQARTQFQTQTIPSIAERFTAMGTGGSQRSGAFRSALGRAGAGLEENLAALKSKYGLAQQGQNNQLLQLLLGAGLQPQTDTGYSAAQPGLFHALAPSFGKAGGEWFFNQLNPAQANQSNS